MPPVLKIIMMRLLVNMVGYVISLLNYFMTSSISIEFLDARIDMVSENGDSSEVSLTALWMGHDSMGQMEVYSQVTQVTLQNDEAQYR